MQDVLNQLTRVLQPHVTDTLTSNTDLDADTASQAVPAVARPLFDGLAGALDNPQDNVGSLVSLYQMLNADDQPTAPEDASPASSGDELLSLVESLLDGSLGDLVNQVGTSLGVAPETADTVVRVVLPKAFAVLRGTTQEKGFDHLLRLVLDDEADEKLDTVLRLIRGADQAGSLMKGLGGLFGG